MTREWQTFDKQMCLGIKKHLSDDSNDSFIFVYDLQKSANLEAVVEFIH